MTDQLQTYTEAFETACARAHRLADTLSDDAFNWKPAPKRWSVGECLVHLNTIAGRELPHFVAAAEAAEAAGRRAQGPFRYGLFSRLFIQSVTPGSRPLPTLPAMKPPPTPVPTRSNLDRDAVLAAMDASTEGFVMLIDRSDGLDLAGVKVASPFLPFVSMPLGAHLEALGQHALRHVGQAERVAAMPGFPRG